MSTSHARHHEAEGGSPSAKEVLAYLHELLGQSAFSASERNRRFLSYVVEETLEGRADRIKAYNIALAAFDRTAEFDPLTDPIVRIEASRLRRSLEHYYLTAGCADRIRISIPKGSYAATFSYQDVASDEAVEAAPAVQPVRRSRSTRWRGRWAVPAVALAICVLAASALVSYFGAEPADRPVQVAGPPSLLILPLEDTSADPSRAFLARALTYDLGMVLTRLPNVAVYAADPGFGVATAAGATASDFTLMGSVQSDEENIRVAMFLVDSRTGRFLESWSFQRGLDGQNLIAAQLEIAQDIRASLEEDCMPAIAATGATALQSALECRRLVVLSKR